MRYAIYFAPEPGSALAELANAWLGRDAVTGETVAHPVIDNLDAASLSALTSSPRRYGFHGTLRAPFRLADGAGEADLLAAMEQFCAGTETLELSVVDIGLLDGFLALQPAMRSSELDEFAGEVVRAFEPFRAPLSEAERERRQPERLSPDEVQNLDRWGYPYVFDRFRFHMTLSNRLDPSESGHVADTARRYFEPVLRRPMILDALTLFVEPGPGAAFKVHSRIPFTAGRQRKTA